VLELYCARQGWTFEVIANLGSGMNDHKKGLKRLLDAIITECQRHWTHTTVLPKFAKEPILAP